MHWRQHFRRDVDIHGITEVETQEEILEEKMVKMIAGISSKPRLEVPMYEANLNPDQMDKYFDYENVAQDKKVKFTVHVDRLKGSVALWWESMHAKWRSKRKGNITGWDRMVAKLKGKFLPQDYQLNLFRHMKNLKHKFMSIKEYIK